MKHKYLTSSKRTTESKQMNIKKLLGIILAFVFIAIVASLLSKCSSSNQASTSKQMAGWEDILVPQLVPMQRENNNPFQDISKLNAEKYKIYPI